MDKRNENIDIMVNDAIDKCCQKTEGLLQFLIKLMKENPDNPELAQIFEGVMSIARSELNAKIAVSDVYFERDLKNHSIQIAKRKEESLKNLSEQVKKGRTR